MPPETPIRDVVDRCHVWESHADPAVRRASKPSLDPIYPAYVVGDSVNITETIQVVAVTRPKSGPDQIDDLLRRLLMAVDTPAPIPEVPAVEKLLQRLVAVGLKKRLRSFLSGQQSNEAATSTATHPTGLERSCLFLMREVGSCCDSVPNFG